MSRRIVALTDSRFFLEVGVPKDIGWGTALLHEDSTITRMCKGCKVTSRDTPDANGRVGAAFLHNLNCPVMERMHNAATRTEARN